jgi:hypothetical protein
LVRLALSICYRYRGLYFIENGYHRAFALLRKGHKFLPCVLLSTDDPEYLTSFEPSFFQQELLLSDKSPLLSDFDTPAAVLVTRRRVRKGVRMTLYAEDIIYD